MNKATLKDALSDITEGAMRLEVAVDDGLMVRIRDAFNGHPRSPSFDAGSSTARTPPSDLPDELRGTLGHSDPVGDAVARSGGQDRGATDARQLVKDVLAAQKAIRRAVDTAARYNRRQASAIDREATERTNDPGCESCARLAGSHGQPRWEPVAVEKAKVGDGTQRLCRWCNDHLKATGDVPTRAQVDAHHSGKRVSRSVA